MQKSNHVSASLLLYSASFTLNCSFLTDPPSWQGSPPEEQFFFPAPALTDPGHDSNKKKERRRQRRKEEGEKWKGRSELREDGGLDMAAGAISADVDLHWTLPSCALGQLSVGRYLKPGDRQRKGGLSTSLFINTYLWIFTPTVSVHLIVFSMKTTVRCLQLKRSEILRCVSCEENSSGELSAKPYMCDDFFSS